MQALLRDLTALLCDLRVTLAGSLEAQTREFYEGTTEGASLTLSLAVVGLDPAKHQALHAFARGRSGALIDQPWLVDRLAQGYDGPAYLTFHFAHLPPMALPLLGDAAKDCCSRPGWSNLDVPDVIPFPEYEYVGEPPEEHRGKPGHIYMRQHVIEGELRAGRIRIATPVYRRDPATGEPVEYLRTDKRPNRLPIVPIYPRRAGIA